MCKPSCPVCKSKILRFAEIKGERIIAFEEAYAKRVVDKRRIETIRLGCNSFPIEAASKQEGGE